MGEGQVVIQIMPYSQIVGQERLKMALELAYIAPCIGGVLVSGQRGTGKSTIVRAFAQMMYGGLPVTLPINATEDRVVGGWQLDELVKGELEPQQGLLEEAHGKILYVDEINLLDDHIVNIILDVTATGVLVIQREGQNDKKPVEFTLVGTMNPDEGDLRPQLLDRFGLMVQVQAENTLRAEILKNVLAFDMALMNDDADDFIEQGKFEDEEKRTHLQSAKKAFATIKCPDEILEKCVALAEMFKVVGHRGDYTLALAAKAEAARQDMDVVSKEHLQRVACLAIQHRCNQGKRWEDADDERVAQLLA